MPDMGDPLNRNSQSEPRRRIESGSPGVDEYGPYYGKYVSLIESKDIVTTLEDQLESTAALLRQIPEQRGNYRYAPDKWSLKELIGHVIDTERIFAYRTLRIGRGDQTPLAGFDQDPYVANARFDSCTLAGLAAEFDLVRRSNLAMLKHFPDDVWNRRGTASPKFPPLAAANSR